MAFELRHPAGMTTHTFQPGVDSDVARSHQDRMDAVIGKLMPDFTLYSYKFAPSAWRYVRGLGNLTASQVNDLETFLDAVAGEPFDFTDGACGPASGWVTVKLLPESYTRVYSYVSGGRQKVDLSMVTVP